jgi:hypothetical protein
MLHTNLIHARRNRGLFERKAGKGHAFAGMPPPKSDARYGGGGGIVKTLVKTAATIAGSQLGPVGAAAGNALAGMAMGEKPKSALMGGALAGLGQFAGNVAGNMFGSSDMGFGQAVSSAWDNTLSPLQSIGNSMGLGDAATSNAGGATGAGGSASPASMGASGSKDLYGPAYNPAGELQVGGTMQKLLESGSVPNVDGGTYSATPAAPVAASAQAAGESGMFSGLVDKWNNASLPTKLAIGAGGALLLGGMGGDKKPTGGSAQSINPSYPASWNQPLQTASEIGGLTPSTNPYIGDLTKYGYGAAQGGQGREHEFIRYAANGGAMRGGALSHAVDMRRGGRTKGPGGGQDDVIPAMLSDGEYVIPADVVSGLGDGSNDAGAAKLDRLRMGVRQHKNSMPKMRVAALPPRAKSPLAYMGAR